MKYLVTGGAGFIGSNLCRRLLNDRHSVACLDDLSTGKYDNIKELEENPKFEFFNHDLTKSFFPEKVDSIFNLACPASPVHYQYNPIKTIKTSLSGAINVLGMAKRCGAKVLQASTSEVYGSARYTPIDEAHPLQGQSPYSASKIGADKMNKPIDAIALNADR